MKAPPERIVILGGGTAGWMAANLIAHRWGGARVTLVESPDIGIIGVGEGSTPQLKTLFDTLGIAETEWMPRCNATYKNGIRFRGWSERAGFESYFHPFPSAPDAELLPIFAYNTRARRTGRDVWAHPDRYFLPALLASERRGPIAQSAEAPWTSYGYHFDAHLVGAFLRDHAKAMGVTHLERRIVHIALTDNGDVSHLLAEGDEAIGANIIIRVLETPLRQLVANAGIDASIIVAEVKKAKGSFGYNVATGEYTDLIKDGIIDPTKVTRTAMQNAASIAGLLLTTECMVTDIPEKEKDAAPGGHGGGMGGGMGGGGMDMY